MMSQHQTTGRIVRLLAVALVASAASLAWAQEDERAPDGAGPVTPPVPLGVNSAEPGDLVMGTGAFGGVAANDAFAADPVADTSSPVFSGVPVGGMAYDAANSRMIFTTSGVDTPDWSTVFEWPISGGTPSQIGTVTLGGSNMRIDALAFANGTLYGILQFNEAPGQAGLYELDQSTFEATLVTTLPDGAFSGLAADPATGTLYGPNDAAVELQSIALDGTLTTVAAYPAGETDIDGATADAGIVYLVPDEPGNYYAWDLAGGAYTNLTAPFASADTFSGAGFVAQGGEPPPEAASVPTLGNWAIALLLAMIVGLGGIAIFRRMA